MTVDLHPITQKENELFKRWEDEREIPQFTIDGAPDPDAYLESKKIVFLLKSVNSEGKKENLREQLQGENIPNWWVRNVAPWCVYINQPYCSIECCRKEIEKAVEQGTIKNLLGEHAYVEIQKQGGGGVTSHNELMSVAKKHSYLLIEQLKIYEPRIIVACGTGGEAVQILDLDYDRRKEKDNGIGYWETRMLSARNTAVIDYCHPANRAGTKVRNLIDQGLGKTIAGLITA